LLDDPLDRPHGDASCLKNGPGFDFLLPQSHIFNCSVVVTAFFPMVCGSQEI
jgi:hypothetical protein